MDLGSIVGKTIDSILTVTPTSNMDKLMDDAPLNSKSTHLQAEEETRNNTAEKPARKRRSKSKSSGIDQLLEDAEWYTTSYGGKGESQTRRSANRERREEIRKKQEELAANRKVEWESKTPEELARIAAERERMRIQRREKREANLRAKRELARKRREARLQNPRRHTRVRNLRTTEMDTTTVPRLTNLSRRRSSFLNREAKCPKSARVDLQIDLNLLSLWTKGTK